MRRLIAAVCICLVCLSLFSACSDNAPETENGKLIELKDDSGAVTGYERRYYNDNGDVTRVDVYDTEDVYQSFIIYDYDDAYRLIQETHYRADGIGEYYYDYTYDDDGNMIEKGYFTMKDGAEVTLYDTDGNETERYTYDSDDSLSKHEVMVDGKWVEATEAETEATEE